MEFSLLHTVAAIFTSGHCQIVQSREWWPEAWWDAYYEVRPEGAVHCNTELFAMRIHRHFEAAAARSLQVGSRSLEAIRTDERPMPDTHSSVWLEPYNNPYELQYDFEYTYLRYLPGSWASAAILRNFTSTPRACNTRWKRRSRAYEHLLAGGSGA